MYLKKIILTAFLIVSGVSAEAATITSSSGLTFNSPTQVIPVGRNTCASTSLVVNLEGDGKSYALDFILPNRCMSGAKSTMASFLVNGFEQFENFSFGSGLAKALDAEGELVSIGLTERFQISFVDSGTNPLGSFDLNISQVPVPASSMLLLTSLFAFGVRRKLSMRRKVS